jgi:hypothetical protein
VGHRAYLVGGHTPEPARPLWHPDNFDADRLTEILAGSRYSIPVLWLLCFESENLTHAAATNSDPPWIVPTAIIETDRAMRLLTERRPRLDRWPGADGFFDEFAELLRGCGFGYLKLDVADMDTFVSDLTGQLTRALHWFDSDDETDFAGFAEFTFFDGTDEDAGVYARGWRFRRPTPWDPDPK